MNRLILFPGLWLMTAAACGDHNTEKEADQTKPTVQMESLLDSSNRPDSPPATHSTEKNTTMNVIEKQVAEKFAAFKKEQQPTLVLEALELIEKAELSAPPLEEMQPQRFSAWLEFFKALDLIIDPAWDQKNLPVKGVAPPPSHHGIVYGTGEVNPADIADPTERAEYEKALRSSKDYSAHYSVQLHLKRIDERAMDDIRRLLTEKYKHLPAVKEAFKALVTSSGLSEKRKEKLEGIG